MIPKHIGKNNLEGWTVNSQAFLRGYRAKEAYDKSVFEDPLASGAAGAALGSLTGAGLAQLGPKTDAERKAGRKKHILRALLGAVTGGAVGGGAGLLGSKLYTTGKDVGEDELRPSVDVAEGAAGWQERRAQQAARVLKQLGLQEPYPNTAAPYRWDTSSVERQLTQGEQLRRWLKEQGAQEDNYWPESRETGGLNLSELEKRLKR